MYKVITICSERFYDMLGDTTLFDDPRLDSVIEEITDKCEISKDEIVEYFYNPIQISIGLVYDSETPDIAPVYESVVEYSHFEDKIILSRYQTNDSGHTTEVLLKSEIGHQLIPLY